MRNINYENEAVIVVPRSIASATIRLVLSMRVLIIVSNVKRYFGTISLGEISRWYRMQCSVSVRGNMRVMAKVSNQ